MSDPNAQPPMYDPNATPPTTSVPPTVPLGYSGPTDADAKNMAMIAHLLNFTLLGPLIVYLVKKDSSPFVAQESREALNFSITCLIVLVIFGVLGRIALPLLCVAGLANAVVIITQIILGIIGGLKAKEGVAYRYPFAIRLVS